MASAGITVMAANSQPLEANATAPPADDAAAASGAEVERARAELDLDGHTRLAALDWQTAGVPLDALALTIRALVAAGYPPVFVLMYDQAWRLCEGLFDAVKAVMRRDVVLDTSIFAWALVPGSAGADGSGGGGNGSGDRGGGAAPIGSNFSTPHRDSTHAECHGTDGRPISLAVWVPLVRVTRESGCMMVVPASSDPLFTQSSNPLHMAPMRALRDSGAAVLEAARPLPAAAGEALAWKPNAVHWGAPCEAGCTTPRVSIAMEFTATDEGGGAGGAGGGSGIRRAELRAGLSMARRLRLVARSLLTYEHWHPGFDGLAPAVLEEALRQMAFPGGAHTVTADA